MSHGSRRLLLRSRCTKCRRCRIVLSLVAALHVVVHASPTWGRLQLGERSLLLQVLHFLGDNIIICIHLCLSCCLSVCYSCSHRWHCHVSITALLTHKALLTGSAPMGRLKHRVLSRLLIIPLELQQCRVQLGDLLGNFSHAVLCAVYTVYSSTENSLRGGIVFTIFHKLISFILVVSYIGVVHNYFGLLIAATVQRRVCPTNASCHESLPMVVTAFSHGLLGGADVSPRSNCRRCNHRTRRYRIVVILLLAGMNHGGDCFLSHLLSALSWNRTGVVLH